MTAKSKLRNAPIATVVPIALNTGVLAKPRTPNPITVERLQNRTDVAVRCGSAEPGLPRSKNSV